MVPGFLAFETSADFLGLMQHVGVNLGQSSFHKPQDSIELLPYLIDVDP
jgi:hypothetical protein